MIRDGIITLSCINDVREFLINDPYQLHLTQFRKIKMDCIDSGFDVGEFRVRNTRLLSQERCVILKKLGLLVQQLQPIINIIKTLMHNFEHFNDAR